MKLAVVFRGVALAVVLLCVSPVARAANVAADWLQPVAGDWTDASKWSSNPFFPTNGTPAGEVYDASITASGGAAYTVQLTQDVAVRNLTLGGSGALRIRNQNSLTTLMIDQQLTIGAGSKLVLSRGRITGGTLAGSGHVEIEEFADGFLNNVSLAGEVRVPSNADLTLAGTTSFAGGVVRFTGQQNDLNVGTAITGQGEIVFDGGAGGSGNVRGPSTGPLDLPIAAGITIRTGDSSGAVYGTSELTFVNDGNIRAETAGHTLTIFGKFRNRNVVHAANGGTLKLYNWTNIGSITAQGGTITTVTMPAPADIGTFQVRDGRFQLEAQTTLARVQALDVADSVIAVAEFGGVDLGGATLAVEGGTNTWRLAGGTFSNGTLTPGASAAPLRVEKEVGFGTPDNLLTNLQLQTDVEMDPGARLTLFQNVNVTPGRTIRLGGSAGTAAQLVVYPAVTWSGSRVVFDGASVQNRLDLPTVFNGTATIPAGAEVVSGTGGGTISIPFGETTATLANAGRIASTTPGLAITLSANKVNNSGRIVAGAGDVRAIGLFQPATELTSGGAIELGPAGDFDVVGKLSLLDSSLAEFTIGGTGIEEFGQVHATTSIALAGTLRAFLAGGFEPNLGDSFTIASVDAGGSVTGAFNGTHLPTWGGGRTFAVNYSPTAVTLTVVVPEPATGAFVVGMMSIAILGLRRRAQEPSFA